MFVCPTGATDTETGQIDAAACLDGCRRCVDACPSHAIALVLDNYPQPAAKNDKVASRLLSLLDRKFAEEKTAQALQAGGSSPAAALVATALARSLRIVEEDCAREADYLIPQSHAVRSLLGELLERQAAKPESAFPLAECRELLGLL
jgi:Fe-S-cluster-containing hydrogenase component 2